jgi:predicted dehydrogenase
MSATNEDGGRRVYRAAVVGCGRMGSTIDDEADAINSPHYPYPWAHAAAYYESKRYRLVAGADLDEARLADFRRRWGAAGLYTDYRRLLAEERPDVVSITTRPDERVDVVRACAEAGVRVVYVTKPLAQRLADADAMVETCRQRGVLLAVAAHLNWDPWYDAARSLFQPPEQDSSSPSPEIRAPAERAAGARPDASPTPTLAPTPAPPFPNPPQPLGRLRSMACHSSHPLSNIQSHTLCLFRRFAGAPVRWVVGDVDRPELAGGEADLSASGYIVYANGVRAFLNSHTGRAGTGWHLEFMGESGWFTSLNAHATYDVWALLPGQLEPSRLQFPNPRRPRSSMLAAIDALAEQLDAGSGEATCGCPGDFGREALEVAIALRESHRRGNVPVHLPLQDRSLALGIA